LTTDQQETITIRFNECINSQDLARLVALMTDDYASIDSTNQVIHGKEHMVATWEGFLRGSPTFTISLQIGSCNNLMVIWGQSTCSVPQLDGPAL
jgi:ketosteroid isomerase-like protein